MGVPKKGSMKAWKRVLLSMVSLWATFGPVPYSSAEQPIPELVASLRSKFVGPQSSLHHDRKDGYTTDDEISNVEYADKVLTVTRTIKVSGVGVRSSETVQKFIVPLSSDLEVTFDTKVRPRDSPPLPRVLVTAQSPVLELQSKKMPDEEVRSSMTNSLGFFFNTSTAASQAKTELMRLIAAIKAQSKAEAAKSPKSSL